MFLVNLMPLIIEIDVIPSHINLIEGQYKLNQIAASKTRLVTKLKKVEV